MLTADALTQLAFLENGHSRHKEPGLCSQQGCLAGGSVPCSCTPRFLALPAQLFFPGGPLATARLPRGARFRSGILFASLCFM